MLLFGSFLNGWLQSFQNRHHIYSSRCFWKSGSVDMDALVLALQTLYAKLDTFNLNDIYTMNETSLQYYVTISFIVFPST